MNVIWKLSVQLFPLRIQCYHFSLREHANISPLVADRVKRFTSRVSTSLPKVIYHDNLSYHSKHCLSFSPLVSQAISLVYAARTPAQND